MEMQTLPPKGGNPNLQSYDEMVKQFDWTEVEKHFSFHQTGKVNLAYEAIDRYAEDEQTKNKIALLYSDANRDESYTFEEMKRMSNRAANVFKEAGIKKGDRVFIFMSRSPELYFAALGAIKIGAIIGPLFEAFMEGAVRDRLENSEAKAIVTTPELIERVPVSELPALEHVFIQGKDVDEKDGVIDFQAKLNEASEDAEVEWVDKEDGLILHYTSGSTGMPKGVLHVHGAMLQHYQTAKWVLDLKEDDVYWCTADPGWVTGTSYGIFGPWLNGVTNVVRGGRFSQKIGIVPFRNTT